MKTCLIFLCLLLMGVGCLVWSNFFPQLNKIDITVKDLPPSLEGFTILHFTDLHGARFGFGQKRIFKLLENERVDMVAITGDLVDARRKEVEPGLELVEKAGELAPVYFVPGNHERASRMYMQLEELITGKNAYVLDNGSSQIHSFEDSSVVLVGVGLDGKVNANLKDFKTIGPVILLSHYPTIFDNYAGTGVDLILAGHTHGGQIRLPWIGALYVPGQGKFPQYDAGLFEKDGTFLYINRGLGTSGIPLRFMCRPEVTLITLRVRPPTY